MDCYALTTAAADRYNYRLQSRPGFSVRQRVDLPQNPCSSTDQYWRAQFDPICELLPAYVEAVYCADLSLLGSIIDEYACDCPARAASAAFPSKQDRNTSAAIAYPCLDGPPPRQCPLSAYVAPNHPAISLCKTSSIVVAITLCKPVGLTPDSRSSSFGPVPDVELVRSGGPVRAFF